MGEHYTRRTVSVTVWCKKCCKITPHRVDDCRRGPCLECVARLDVAHAASVGLVEQASLFPSDDHGGKI